MSAEVKWLPTWPAAPGYSQSMSTPSKMPAPVPGPPYPPGLFGRLPLMNMSMQEETSALREASVAAASEKYFEYVQPPSDIRIFRFGCLALSFLSWLKLPAIGWLNTSPTPSTLMSAP